jgi:hypothetical protein
LHEDSLLDTGNPDAILESLCVITLVNDDAILKRNLLASELVSKHRVPVQIERGAPSASIGYNKGLEATSAPIVILAHQDVYFPPSWHHRLARAVAIADSQDPEWAVLAPFGMGAIGAEHIGDVWSTSVGRRIGRRVASLAPVQSVDELVIVLRRASGLRFDPNLPNYHLYGLDIVQTAIASGKGAYVADLPVVHNDKFHDVLRRDFGECYAFIRRKWRDRLPLRTPVLWVGKSGMALPLYRLRAWYSLSRRRQLAADTSVNPSHYAAMCGWEVSASDTTAPGADSP